MPTQTEPTTKPGKNGNFDLAQEIIKALQDLVTLEIRTMVGDITVDGTGDKSLTEAYHDVPLIETKINMLDGDIDTAINNKFVDDPNYKFLLDYHSKREEKGFQMVQDNVNALLSLLKLNERTKQ